jgi:hypothetical protein
MSVRHLEAIILDSELLMSSLAYSRVETRTGGEGLDNTVAGIIAAF